MKNKVTVLPIVISLLISMLLGGACSRGGNSERQAPANSSPPQTAKREPDARLLLRERHTGVLAVDGLTFFIRITMAEVNDEVKQDMGLTSEDGLMVDAEGHSEFKDPVKKKPLGQPQAWAKDPKDFDFQLDWEIDLNEHTKFYMGEPLKITVRETLKLSKVADPKVTKSWTYSYDLQEPDSLSEPDKKADQVALEQIKNNVAPVRGPVLKEIRTFIQNNRSRTE